MNKLLYFMFLIPLISVPFLIDDSFGCKVNCAGEDFMRIQAGYDTYVWWGVHHHLTGYYGFSNKDISGSDAVTLSQTERTLKPAFIVRPFVQSGGITADYSVQYTISDSEGTATHISTNYYTNMVFHSNFDGEADSFPAVYNIPEHSTITYTLKVTKMK